MHRMPVGKEGCWREMLGCSYELTFHFPPCRRPRRFGGGKGGDSRVAKLSKAARAAAALLPPGAAPPAALLPPAPAPPRDSDRDRDRERERERVRH